VANALNGDISDGTVDLYELLQVSPHASFVVIRAAYRALARDYHPDVNSTPEAATTMGRLNAAYAVLSDPERRARYHAYYTRTTRPNGAPRAGGSQPSTRRTGAPRRSRSSQRAFSQPPATSHTHDRSTAMLMMGRILIVTALTAVFAMLLLTAWVAFTDTDDWSPLTSGTRGSTSTSAPMVAPGARSQRPCGIGRVDILSC